MNTPSGYRPLYNEYLAVGHILRYEKTVYDMTEREFVNCCVFYSHGVMHPDRALDIYRQLMEEARL